MRSPAAIERDLARANRDIMDYEDRKYNNRQQISKLEDQIYNHARAIENCRSSLQDLSNPKALFGPNGLSFGSGKNSAALLAKLSIALSDSQGHNVLRKLESNKRKMEEKRDRLNRENQSLENKQADTRNRILRLRQEYDAAISSL